MPRTKRVSCSGPGISRRPRGKGFEYLDSRTGRRSRTLIPWRGYGPPDPTCVEGRVDLPRADGSYPGAGHRRCGTAAVPLSLGVAAEQGPREVRQDAGIRPSPAGDAGYVGRAHALEGSRPPQGAGVRGPHARPGVLPYRRGELRRAERELRARHASEEACATAR